MTPRTASTTPGHAAGTVPGDTPAKRLGYVDLPRLMTAMTGDEKHSPSATSTLDVLWVLYRDVLAIDPDDPLHPDRDRFLLSKGHGPVSFYAVLAACGFFPTSWLDGFAGYDSPLGHHPDGTLVPGVEIGSGSLGHGLPMAAGVAAALRIRYRTTPAGSGLRRPRVVCLIGDAELDEGSNHEAIAWVGRQRLDALTVVVIDNDSATHGWPGGIEARFATEGWSTASVSGRDHRALGDALGHRPSGRPHAIVASVDREGRT